MEKQVTELSVTCFVFVVACEQAPATTNTKLRSTCGRPASLAECGIAYLFGVEPIEDV
jgi:hypothetical protein